MSKTLKKIVCATLALGTLVSAATMFSGCTTNRPEAELKLEFNGKTYTLEYTMYRKIAPATVNHFIKLVEEGYYNGLCVHNYEENKMYTGAYYYDETKTDLLDYKPYFETVATYKNFPHSVWKNSDLDTPLYTLYGEFSKNDLVIKNGSFTKQSYGSLTMYYTDKSDCDVNAYIKRNDDSETKYSKRKYAYNSATSQFYISLSTTATTNTAYCTFATLNDDSKGTLEKLQKAIADYIQANFGDEDDAKADFVNVVEDVDVDTDDPIVGDDRNTADFSVPVEPITIKSVKITKY